MRLALPKSVLFVPLASAVFLACGLHSAPAWESGPKNNNKLLDRIVADWKTRQVAISTIRYKAQGELILPGVAPDRTDSRYPKALTWTLDLKTNRMRKECAEFVLQGNVDQRSYQFITYLFDGTKHQRYYPRDRNTTDLYTPPPQLADLTWHTGDGFIVSQDFPIFLGHGSVPTAQVSPEPSSLLVPVKKEDFVIRDKGIHQGSECVVLRSAKMVGRFEHEYWVDLAKQSAVLQDILILNEVPVITIDIRYKKGKAGWLPESWIHTRYDPADQAVKWVEEITDVTVELDPKFSNEEFHKKPTPGMRVLFENKKGLYQMQMDGTFVLLDLKGQTGTGVPWYLFFIIAVIALVLVLGAKYYAKKRQQRAKQ